MSSITMFMPLAPCSRPRNSIVQSQVCQNGLDQRPETKAKFTRSTPWPRMCTIVKCPSTRKISTMPDTRMKYQVHSSIPVDAGRVRYAERDLVVVDGRVTVAIATNS